MRIVFLAPFALHPKSTTRWRVLPLAEALAAEGHAVRVVIPPYDWPAHGGQRWQRRGVQVVNVAVPAGKGLAQALLLAVRMRREALAWQPDVVHACKPVGVAGLAAATLLWQPGAPPVVLDADDWEAGWAAAQGHSAAYQRLLAWQERWLLRRGHAVTAASAWLRRWILALRGERSSSGGDDKGVFYLPNGAAPTPLPTPTPSSGDARRVLLYTRFVEHSPAQVWSVWRRVLAAQPAAELWVAGQGWRGEETALQRLAAADGLASAVRLLGWVPAASRPGLLAAVDAAVLPVADTWLNRAKCPMRLVDLLAAGVPVAVHAVGEYAMYVRDGVTGLLAPSGDDQALAMAVVRLLRDRDLRAALAAGASQRMQTEFAWPRLAAVAAQAYRCAGRPGRMRV